MLQIDDLNKLKITKVKRWAIYFTYDNERYLLHGTSDCGESGVTLYKRNWNGTKFKLERIASDWGDENVEYEYIKSIPRNTNTLVYAHIDKEYFVKKLSLDGFVYGIFDKEVENIKLNNENIREQIRKLENEIRQLRREII